MNPWWLIHFPLILPLLRKDVPKVASFFEDLEIAGVIASDLASFAAGNPVTASPTIGGNKVNVSVVHLANGAEAPYQVISGSLLGILGTVIALGTEYSAGLPVAVAAKEGNSWYGLTLQKAA